MSGPGVELLVLLLKAVARLAWPADVQLAYLAARGLLPSTDELALEFSDEAVLVPQFVANGWLEPADAEAISAIDKLLAEMSGHAKKELWTEEAVRSASEWVEVRRLARDALMD